MKLRDARLAELEQEARRVPKLLEDLALKDGRMLEL
jgi:colicin import membrane protein